MGEASLAGLRSEPQATGPIGIRAVVLIRGSSATRHQAFSRAPSCLMYERGRAGSVRSFKIYDQLKIISGEVFQIGYKKSLLMMVLGQVSSNMTPAGRWVVLLAPLADSALQVRDSTPALFLPDVMDVAWSPHDAWLASCSVDNTVVIWNAVKFPGLGLLWLGGGRNGLLIILLPVGVWSRMALSLAGGSMCLTVDRDPCVLSVIQLSFFISYICLRF